jgi:hypothetical protein
VAPDAQVAHVTAANNFNFMAIPPTRRQLNRKAAAFRELLRINPKSAVATQRNIQSNLQTDVAFPPNKNLAPLILASGAFFLSSIKFTTA